MAYIIHTLLLITYICETNSLVNNNNTINDTINSNINKNNDIIILKLGAIAGIFLMFIFFAFVVCMAHNPQIIKNIKDSLII
jgi:CRISPR/Cas system-associated protein Csx1